MHGDHHVYAVPVEPVEESGEPLPLLLAKVVDTDMDVVVDTGVVLVGREQLQALHVQCVF